MLPADAGDSRGAMPTHGGRDAAPPGAALPPMDAEERGRLRLIEGTIAVLLIVLVAGLAYRQLGRSADSLARESRQSLRRLILPAPRGTIYDREHRVLATTRPCTAAALNLGALRVEIIRRDSIARGEAPSALTPARYEQVTAGTLAAVRLAVAQEQVDRLNGVLGRDARVDAASLERAFRHERATPFVVMSDLTASEAARVRAILQPDDPVQLVSEYRRWHPQGERAAQVLGRTRRVAAMWPDADGVREIGWPESAGDSGIEKQSDERLRGRPGDELLRVDAVGFQVGPALAHHEPLPGADVVLSLDLDLQEAAERAMGAARGAAVAIDVVTGEVLAMASRPSFDPNAVSPALSPRMKRRIDAEGGWLNRAAQGLYPPGSLFKVFTVLAGLRRGTLHPGDVVHCDGACDIGGHRFVCHNPDGHGDVSLGTALAHSCNVYAYQAGLAAGPEALAAEARRFHFDRPTSIDLPHETRRMLVPDPAWKRAAGEGAWTIGDTVNLSIGQGALRISPLQAACAIASLARRETLTVPTLLYQPGRRPTGGEPAEPLDLRGADYAALVRAMQAVIETGIGRDAQVPGVTMAGKTGTAQVLRPEGMMNVAWFVAFAPVEQPRIAVAVTLEGDEPGVEYAGAKHAAPVVRELIGTYFGKRRSSE